MASRRHPVVAIVTVLAVVAAITACDDAEYSGDDFGDPVAPVVAHSGGEPALRAARAFDIGAIVVDERGRVLYRYDRDSADPPKSVCAGDCADTWEPVNTDGELDVTGIERSLVGSVTRLDGSDQLTLAGWPLYRYAKDELPGETSGQGVQRAWYPISPTGKKVQTTSGSWQADAIGF